MMYKKWKFRLSRIGFYFPFTPYFLLFALVSLVGYSWLNSRAQIKDSSFSAILELLVSAALWFSLIIVFLGFASTFFNWILFKIKLKNGKVHFKMETQTSDDRTDRRKIKIELRPSLKPLLGFIRLRMIYDKTHFSKKYSLLVPSDRKLFDRNLNGVFLWDLPEIREYSIETSLIYFEDLFQFFSFVVPISTSERIYTPPDKINSKEVHANPRKTEETSVRIDELKRVEGELLHYKDFESNDDVRRIVWKIYAKNKELVVRVPEVLDPYASHIYLFCSFYNSFSFPETEVINVPFLNFYKRAAWTVFDSLSKKGFEVRFIPDQSAGQLNSNDNKELVRYAITLSNWQREMSLKELVNRRTASVVLISSLSDPNELKELVEEMGSEVTFLLVKLSECMHENKIREWVKWIFVQENETDKGLLKAAWNLSPLRLKILQNEKELEKIIKEQDRSVVFQSNLS